MAHVPTVRNILSMKAKDFPKYIGSNLNFKWMRNLANETRDWYYEKYLTGGKINPLFHFIAIASTIQYASTFHWHKYRHERLAKH
jgi:hypothetical protein